MAVIIILIVVVGGMYWYKKMYPRQAGGALTNATTAMPTPTVKGEIFIERNLFVPDSLSIKVGETVTWVNMESYGHDVKSDDGTFVSPKLATGEKFSHTFTKAGTYTYICAIHPFMHGTIIVTK